MENQQQALQQYIYNQIQTGLNPDEIAQQLRTAGWDENNITTAFNAVQSYISANSIPTPPAQEAQPQPEQHTATQTAETTHLSATFTPTGQKRGRIKTSWILLKQSLSVLKHNKKLVRYPLMAGIISVIFTVIVFGPAIVFGEGSLYEKTPALTGGEDYTVTTLGYLVLLAYYILSYFIIFIYNAGLTAHVLDVFRGKSQGYSHYMKAAWAKKLPIFIYAVITTTVGVILRAIEERFALIGWIVSRILGLIWGLANLFTIAIIVDSNDSAPKAIKNSVLLFKSRWGENIAARITFGGLALLLALGIFIPAWIIFAIILLPFGVIGLILYLTIIMLLFLAFAIIQSAASNILNTALYFYAKYQQIPAAFDAQLLNSVFIPKKKRRGLLKRK